MNYLKSEKYKEHKNKISSNFDIKNISEISFSKNHTRGSQICGTLPSEDSTINTRSYVVKEKKKSLLNEDLYQNNFINLFNSINKVFESLDQLIINDNNSSNEEEGNTYINSFSCKVCDIDKKEKEFNKRKSYNNYIKCRDKSKSISIPKLNFNRIFEYYQNEKVKIIETQIEKKSKNLMKHHHKHHHNQLHMKVNNDIIYKN